MKHQPHPQQAEPTAAIPTALAREASASAVVYRLLIEIQLRGGMTAYTPPVSANALADSIVSSPASVKHAVLWLLGRGYIHRGYGSGPHGGRWPRYRIAWGQRVDTGGTPNEHVRVPRRPTI